MDVGIKTGLYILFGIIYLIFQIRKNVIKKRKLQEQRPAKQTTGQSQREIYDPAEDFSEQTQPANSLEDLMEQYFPPEKSKYIKQPVAKSYVKPDLEAFEEKSVESDEEDDHMEHFDAYDHEVFERGKWSKMLHSAQGAEDAFVASEIFNKKY